MSLSFEKQRVESEVTQKFSEWNMSGTVYLPIDVGVIKIPYHSLNDLSVNFSLVEKLVVDTDRREVFIPSYTLTLQQFRYFPTFFSWISVLLSDCYFKHEDHPIQISCLIRLSLSYAY